MKFIFFALFLIKLVIAGDDELSINIIPSDKYKLNRRDLINLKSDIERQVLKIVIKYS